MLILANFLFELLKEIQLYEYGRWYDSRQIKINERKKRIKFFYLKLHSRKNRVWKLIGYKCISIHNNECIESDVLNGLQRISFQIRFFFFKFHLLFQTNCTTLLYIFNLCCTFSTLYVECWMKLHYSVGS